jgi:hypothetical protein
VLEAVQVPGSKGAAACVAHQTTGWSRRPWRIKLPRRSPAPLTETPARAPTPQAESLSDLVLWLVGSGSGRRESERLGCWAGARGFNGDDQD